MRASRLFAMILSSLAVVSAATPLWAQFEEMIARVPREANAMVLINGDKVFASPIAKKEGWQADRQKMFESGMAFLPPTAESGMLAAHLDFEFMLPLWEISMFHLNREATPEKIVERVGGTLDRINGLSAVAAPGDAYVVLIDPTLVSMFVPKNRQVVARWVRDYLAAKNPTVSPYLMEAYGFAQDNGTPVILALDLDGVVTEDGAKQVLVRSAIAKSDPQANIDAMAKVLASLRGVTLGITLKDRAFGKIKVDFDEDTAPLAKYGKQFLLHVLAKHGAMLDELDSWEAKVSGKQVTLEGYLTSGGIQRLSTLFHQPMSVVGAKSDATAGKVQTEESIAREATLSYYKGINKLLKDLKIDSREFKTLGNTALWMDRYASRIDELPVLNVDPDMIAFSNYASGELRSASSTLRRGLAAGSVAAANTPTQYNTFSYGQTYGYSYRGGLLWGGAVPYGDYGTVDVVNARATWAAQSQARTLQENAGTRDARQVLKDLEAANGKIRQQMSLKYKTEFSK